jgi:hypothetical protein
MLKPGDGSSEPHAFMIPTTTRPIRLPQTPQTGTAGNLSYLPAVHFPEKDETL